MPKPGDFAEISPIRFLYYLINDLTTSCKMTQCLSTPGQVVQNQIAEKKSGRMWLQSTSCKKTDFAVVVVSGAIFYGWY